MTKHQCDHYLLSPRSPGHLELPTVLVQLDYCFGLGSKQAVLEHSSDVDEGYSGCWKPECSRHTDFKLRHSALVVCGGSLSECCKSQNQNCFTPRLGIGVELHERAVCVVEGFFGRPVPLRKSHTVGSVLSFLKFSFNNSTDCFTEKITERMKSKCNNSLLVKFEGVLVEWKLRFTREQISYKLCLHGTIFRVWKAIIGRSVGQL